VKSPAIIFPEPGRAVVDEVPIPDLRDDEVLVDIQYSALSPGTERWCLTGKLDVPDEPPVAFPHLPGYQAVRSSAFHPAIGCSAGTVALPTGGTAPGGEAMRACTSRRRTA